MYTDSRLVRVEITGLEEPDVIGRDDRRARGAGELETRVHAMLLAVAAGADEFQVEALREYRLPCLEKPERRVLVMRVQRMPDIAVQPTRQRDQPGATLGREPIVARHRLAAKLPLDVAARDQVRQVPIAGAVLHE